MIDNDDYCSDRLYPKHKQPPILINKPKDDSKKDSKGQPEVRSESNNSKSNEGREENSRDFGTSSRGRGD